MNKEQRFFMQVLRNHLHGNETKINNLIDWKILYEIVQQQQLSAIFYLQTKQPIFYKSYAAQLYCAINQEKMIRDIENKLNKEKIEFIFLKGAIIKKYYPYPATRTMGDLDLVVHANDKKKVGYILEKLGFRFDGGKDELVYYKGQFEIELHDSLAYDKDKFENNKTINNFWKFVNNNKLDINFHFVYLLFHLRRHIIDNGVGFRQFLDIAIMIKNEKLNWNWIVDFLQTIDLYVFAFNVFSFVSRCFSIEIPLDLMDIDENFYKIVIDSLFENGVFGFINEENEDVKGIIRITTKEDTSILCARIRFGINQLFPSYYYMSRMPYCRYVRHSKFLLPFAWIHRLVYRFNFRKNRKNFLKKLFISNNKILERERIIKDWGL